MRHILNQLRTRVKARPLEGTVSITRTASRGAAVFSNREVDSCSLDGGGKTEVGRGYQKQTFAEAPLARRSYEVAARSPRSLCPQRPALGLERDWSGVRASVAAEPPRGRSPGRREPASSRLDRAGLGRARRARALSPAEAEQARHKLPGAAPASRTPARPPSAMPAAAPARPTPHAPRIPPGPEAADLTVPLSRGLCS